MAALVKTCLIPLESFSAARSMAALVKTCLIPLESFSAARSMAIERAAEKDTRGIK